MKCIVFLRLWEIGVEYLVECAEEGRKQADKLMQQLSIEDELMAEKVRNILVLQKPELVKCLFSQILKPYSNIFADISNRDGILSERYNQMLGEIDVRQVSHFGEVIESN